ncbi:hypothetical protein LTR84_008328 [Exophiala bonariae]|uniref:Zn(2)-C6 fungal-type domain-containing protein n=1 Tax=Exophiala bonariae TaxID=1690606 RepID=A0AAV9MXT6_9EURO|nr:hypothetical protein LTR84_008328 [Exophiala bonariae]
MVGVPGKSKGCSTCRRRKKGCDQKRPICGQCASSGYECGGYNRDRTFILHPATKAVQRAIFLPRSKPSALVLPGSLNRHVVLSQCRSLFWDLYNPTGDCVCRDPYIVKCGHPMNWTEVIHSVAEEDSSLKDAFSALSISRVGQGHKDFRLVHESTRLYGRALKELQLALYDPQRMHSNHVLMACMLLGLYELFEGPAFHSKSWIAHAQGAARLIELRGPARHQEWDAHHPFLAARIPTIYASILSRQATYLASEDWLSVPWEKQSRTYFDRLIDMAVQVPGLLEKFDLILDKDQDIEFDLLQVLEECKDLQIRMNRWKDGTKGSAVPRVQKHDSSDPSGYPFETDLWFENHLFVQARVFYYTCSLALAEAATGIVRALDLRDHHLPDTAEPNPLLELFTAEKHAANICRSVPYCIQPEMSALGANIINFPANLAYAFYQRAGHRSVVRWLVKAFEDVKARGVHVENIVQDLSDLSADKDVRIHRWKGGASDDSNASGSSPESAGSVSSCTTIFVYEDPSKSYYDASNDPG